MNLKLFTGAAIPLTTQGKMVKAENVGIIPVFQPQTKTIMKKLIAALTLVLALGATLSAGEKYQLSTHVLDTTLGKPGEGVDVKLEKRNDKGEWVELGTNTTDHDGRIRSFLELKNEGANDGVYRFTFSLDKYFDKRGEKTVFPEAVIVFRIEGDEHYHIPLVVTPYALSTYRGS